MVKFKIVLDRDEDGWYVATCPSLPGCISQGKTERQAKANMREAIQLHLRALAEDGIPIRHKNGRKLTTVSVAV